MKKVGVKVKHEKKYGLRINRFARNRVELDNKRTDKPWRDKFQAFITKEGEKVYVDHLTERNKLLKGELCHTVCSYTEHFLSGFRVSSVKAAKRHIARHGWMFPSGTKFSSWASWFGYNVDFIIKNPNFNKEEVERELYSNLELKPSFNKLSGIKYYDNLVNALRDEGYFVSVNWVPEYTYLSGEVAEGYWRSIVMGKNAMCCICTENNQDYTNLSGCIGIESDDHFDKWSRTVSDMKIPRTKKGIKEVIDQIKHVATEYYSSYEEYEKG